MRKPCAPALSSSHSNVYHLQAFHPARDISMELPITSPLHPASDRQRLFAAAGPASAAETADAAERPRQPSKRFDDILGQTLAGPLFANWTPQLPPNPVAGNASTSSSTTSPIDPNARREGRKRSRR
jgi:hypothetical protein